MFLDRSYFGYYVPGYGTVGANYSFDPQLISHFGSPFPTGVVIGSDIASRVFAVDSLGRLAWEFEGSGRSFLVDGDLVYSAVQGVLFRHSISQGRTLDTIDIGGQSLFLRRSGDYILSAVSDPSDPDHQWLDVYDGKQPDWYAHRVHRFELERSSYPRDAEIVGDNLFIANTFTHNVSILSLSSGSEIYREEFYFPNEIEIVSDTTFLVTEEHGNRVLKIDWQEGRRELFFGSPVSLYADASTTASDIAAQEARFTTQLPNDGRVLSTSSVEISGNNTLYSPNGIFRLPSGSTFVADGDNARVVLIEGGTIVGSIGGLNSPNSIASWNRAPVGPGYAAVRLDADGAAAVDLTGFSDPDADELLFRVDRVEGFELRASDGTLISPGHLYALTDGLRVSAAPGISAATGTEISLSIVDRGGAAKALTVRVLLPDEGGSTGSAPVDVSSQIYLGTSGALHAPMSFDADGDALVYILTEVPIGIELLQDGRVLQLGDTLTSDTLAALEYRVDRDGGSYLGDIRFAVRDDRNGEASLSLQAWRSEVTLVTNAQAFDAGIATIRIDPEQLFGSANVSLLVRSTGDLAVYEPNGGRLSDHGSALTKHVLTLDGPIDLQVTSTPEFAGKPLVLEAFDGAGRRITLQYDFEAGDQQSVGLRGLDAWLKWGSSTPVASMLRVASFGSLDPETVIRLVDENGAEKGGFFTLDGLPVRGSSVSVTFDELHRVAFTSGINGERDVLSAALGEGDTLTSVRWTVQSVHSPSLHWTTPAPPLLIQVDRLDGTRNVFNGWHHRNELIVEHYAPGAYEVRYAAPGEAMRSYMVTKIENGIVALPDAGRSVPDHVAHLLQGAGSQSVNLELQAGSVAVVASISGPGSWWLDETTQLVAGQHFTASEAANLRFVPDRETNDGPATLSLAVSSTGGVAPVTVNVRAEIDAAPLATTREAWLSTGSSTSLSDLLTLFDAESPADQLIVTVADLTRSDTGSYLTIDGVRAPAGDIEILASELGRLAIVAGSAGARDILSVELRDSSGQLASSRWAVQSLGRPQLEWPELDGPIFVRIVDTDTGRVRFNAWHYGSTFDLSSLGNGSFRIDTARVGEGIRSDTIKTIDHGFTAAPDALNSIEDVRVKVAAMSGPTSFGFELPDGAKAIVRSVPVGATVRRSDGDALRVGDVIDAATARELVLSVDPATQSGTQALELTLLSVAGRPSVIRAEIEIDGPPILSTHDARLAPGSSIAFADLVAVSDGGAPPSEQRIRVTDIDGPGQGGYFVLDGRIVDAGEFEIAGSDLGRLTFVAGPTGSRDLIDMAVVDRSGQADAARIIIEASRNPSQLPLPDPTEWFLVRISRASTSGYLIDGWVRGTGIDLSGLAPGDYKAEVARSGEAFASTFFKMLPNGVGSAPTDTPPTASTFDGWIAPQSATPLSTMLEIGDRESTPSEMRVVLTDLNGSSAGGHLTLDGVLVESGKIDIALSDLGRVALVTGAAGSNDLIDARVTDLTGQAVQVRWTVHSNQSPALDWSDRETPILLRVEAFETRAAVIDRWIYGGQFDLEGLAPGSYRASFAKPGDAFRTLELTVTKDGVLMPTSPDSPPVVRAWDASLTPSSISHLSQMLDLFDDKSSPSDLKITLVDENGAAKGGFFSVDGLRVEASSFVISADQIKRVSFVAGSAGGSDDLRAIVTDGSGQTTAVQWKVAATGAPALLLPADEKPLFLRVTDLKTGATIFDRWVYDGKVPTDQFARGEYQLAYAESGADFTILDIRTGRDGAFSAPRAVATDIMPDVIDTGGENIALSTLRASAEWFQLG